MQPSEFADFYSAHSSRLPEVSEHDHERIVEPAGLAEMRDRVAAAFSDL
jgi:hypothetical protein